MIYQLVNMTTEILAIAASHKALKLFLPKNAKFSSAWGLATRLPYQPPEFQISEYEPAFTWSANCAIFS